MYTSSVTITARTCWYIPVLGVIMAIRSTSLHFLGRWTEGMWSNVRRSQGSAGESASVVTITLVLQHHAQCFGGDLQSEYYASCSYLHVTEWWHFSIARLAGAHADEPKIVLSTLRYREEKNSFVSYHAVKEVWREHLFVVVEIRSNRDPQVNDEWIIRHGALREAAWRV